MGDDPVVGYYFIVFDDVDSATLWFITNLKEWEEEFAKYDLNGTITDYPIGERGMVVEFVDESRDWPWGYQCVKSLYAKTGRIGFTIRTLINPYQPDEMLPEKMANIAANKLGISETTLLSILGLILMPTILRRRTKIR